MSAQIFLSYARIDNDPDTTRRSEVGWVDHFQDRLLDRLRKLGRLDVSFWRDVAEIPGAERFTPHILEGLRRAHVLLPVLSPVYLQRPWCRDELDKFTIRTQQEPDLGLRIVPVFKRPVDVELPPSLKGRAGYHFYRHDEVRNRVVEFFRDGEELDREKYREAIDTIADYIASVLPSIAPFPVIANPPAESATISIYVADPAPDMSAAYDKIAAELKSLGFRVVLDPLEELPIDGDAADAALTAAVASSKLAVHLLGASAGRRTGTERLADFQLRRTHALAKQRVIWAPATMFDDPMRPDSTVRLSGRDPLKVLAEFGEYRAGDVVSGASFEIFLQDLTRRGEALRPTVVPPDHRDAGRGAEVYVFGAEADAQLVDHVTGTLIDEHDLDAKACTFDGSPDEIRKLHEKRMRDADGILYCWGHATLTWLSAYTDEPRAIRRERPYRATALLPGPPIYERKRTYRTRDVSLILPPMAVVSPEGLLPFVQAVTGPAP